MELPDDSPRLPKIPFIIGDLILLSVAALLAYRMGTDPTTAEVVGIVVSTGLAVAVGLAPFVISYAREQDRMLRDRERMLESLVRTTSTAADQASIAANGLNEIAESTKQNLAALDSLPLKIQAAREAAEAQSAKQSAVDLEPLKDELALLRGELAAKTTELTARLDAAVVAMENSAQAMATSSSVAAPIAIDTSAEPAEAKPAPKPARRKKKEPPPPPPAEDSLFGGEIGAGDLPDAEAVTAEPAPEAPVKKRKPRQKKAAKTTEPTAPPADAPLPSVEDSTDDQSAEDPTAGETSSTEAGPTGSASEDPAERPAADDPSEPEAPAAEAKPAEIEQDETAETTADEPPPPQVDESDAPAEEDATSEDVLPVADEVLDDPAPEEPALSADGMTRITVTAYIGIGNRLFIRGDGPGLSRDEGVPLQFVSIGKWRWETDGATAPIKVTLWKNDEEECTSAGEIELRPGAQLETSANF